MINCIIDSKLSGPVGFCDRLGIRSRPARRQAKDQKRDDLVWHLQVIYHCFVQKGLFGWATGN